MDEDSVNHLAHKNLQAEFYLQSALDVHGLEDQMRRKGGSAWTWDRKLWGLTSSCRQRTGILDGMSKTWAHAAVTDSLIVLKFLFRERPLKYISFGGL